MVKEQSFNFCVGLQQLLQLQFKRVSQLLNYYIFLVNLFGNCFHLKKGSKYVFTFHQKNQIQFYKISSAGKIYFQIVGYLEDIIQNCSTLQSIIWKLYIANPPGRPTVFKCPRQALICHKFNSKTFLRAIFKGRPIPGI